MRDKLKKYAWQIVACVLALLLTVQTIRINGFFVLFPGLKAELHNMEISRNAKQAELDRISTTKNEQKAVSARTVEKVRVVTRDAKARAKRLEQAPAANQCVTKPAVLGEDL